MVTCARCRKGDEPGRLVYIFPTGNFHRDCKAQQECDNAQGKVTR